jgi:5-hydroxyisourate hydrolase-like protein (transthyretin family)
MTAFVLAVVIFAQGAGALQPGTGIVTGSLKTSDGRPAAGVRVGAVDVDDPTSSSLLSVSETDPAGRYRLINIPEGKYFIVAGRLNDLHYFPAGADRSKATEVQVEAARIRSDVNFTVPGGIQRPVRPASGSAVNTAETRAYQQIAAEKNIDKSAQLVLQFEKNFPKSPRLPEAYVALSRTLANQQTQMDKAVQYAEKAVALARNLKNESNAPGKTDAVWTNWVAAIDASAQSNLAWVKQMQDWQNRSLMTLVAPRRAR